MVSRREVSIGEVDHIRARERLFESVNLLAVWRVGQAGFVVVKYL